MKNHLKNSKGERMEEKETKLCNEGLIEGNPSFAIVNPNKDRAQIFFDKTELETYCTEHCPELRNCKDDTRKKLTAMFDASDKEHMN